MEYADKRYLCLRSRSSSVRLTLTSQPFAQNGLLIEGVVPVLAQYVYTAAMDIFRIVRHGHRWRALRGEREVGRYETPEDALHGLREADPALRLPRRLGDWRFIPAAPLGHLSPPSPSALARLASA